MNKWKSITYVDILILIFLLYMAADAEGGGFFLWVGYICTGLYTLSLIIKVIKTPNESENDG